MSKSDTPETDDEEFTFGTARVNMAPEDFGLVRSAFARDLERRLNEARLKDEPTGTEAEVCKDIAARQAVGLAKYGVSVEGNPLDLGQWLQHAYEEVLDQAVYLKRAMAELKKEGK